MKLLLTMVLLIMTAIALPGAIGSVCTRSPAGYLREDCETIIASDLAPDEKAEAVGALLSGYSGQPAHETVLDWNRQALKDVTGQSPPSATPTMSQGSIRDAWTKLLGLHPSIQQQGALFHSGEGVALLASHYIVEPHAGTLPGDCHTTYHPQAESVALSLLVNGVQQGTGSEVMYTASSDATFTAQLSVSQTTYVERYKDEPFCCLWKHGCSLWACWKYCLEWCPNCKYDSSETWHDSVVVEDSLEAKLHIYTPEASLSAVEQYGDTVRLIFSPDAVENTFLETEVQDFVSQPVVYSALMDTSGFATLTVTAKAQMPMQEIDFLLPAGSDCQLSTVGHFGGTVYPCTTWYTGSRISISTDKLFYKAGDTIYVSVEGAEGDVTIEYAGQMHSTIDEDGFTLKAVSGSNRITALAAWQESSVTIGIVNPDIWRFFAKLLVLCCVVAGTYSFIKNWARRRFGTWPAH